jgi:hypothetical protein
VRGPPLAIVSSDAFPQHNSRDLIYAVTQFGRIPVQRIDATRPPAGPNPVVPSDFTRRITDLVSDILAALGLSDEVDRPGRTIFGTPVSPAAGDILRKAANAFNNQISDFGANKMRKLILMVAMAATVIGLQASSHTARAADMGVYSRERVALSGHCSRQRICGPEGCGWQRFCRVGCLDRYRCSSLYGAYGPYGGSAYWGAYTSVGWGQAYFYR